MIEMYKDTTEELTLYATLNGENVSADFLPIVEATDEHGLPVETSTVQPNDEGTYDSYKLTIDPDETDRFRKIRLEWNFDVSGSPRRHVDHIEVVTPLARPDEFWTQYPEHEELGFAKTKQLERVVRGVIEDFCMQQFEDFGRKVFSVRGSGGNELIIPERIYNLYMVSSAYPEFTLFDIENEIEHIEWRKDTPWSLKTKYNYGTHSFNQMHPRRHVSIDYVDFNRSFSTDRTYLIDADVGYEYVPNRVNQAAIILMNEYLCDALKYHSGNLQRVTSADFSLSYFDDHRLTTGNVIADQLLGDYVNRGFDII